MSSVAEPCDPSIEACGPSVYVPPEGPGDLASSILYLMAHIGLYMIPLLTGSSTTAIRLGWPFRLSFFAYMPTIITTFVYILVQENTDAPEFTDRMIQIYEIGLSNFSFFILGWAYAVVWLEAFTGTAAQWQGAIIYTFLAYRTQRGLMKSMYEAVKYMDESWNEQEGPLLWPTVLVDAGLA